MPIALSSTANEPSFEWNESWKPQGVGLFDLRPPGVPPDASPIFDVELDCVIGYRKEAAGVIRTYGLDGSVSLSEEPLETPLIDPLDALFLARGVFRAGLNGVGQWGAKALGASLERSALCGLRTRYYALMQRPLRFGAKPLQRMRQPHRFVPVHILRLAMKYGKREPDPKGAPGLFMYKHGMMRDGKPYMLEILVRDSDYTILYFVYKEIK